MKLSALLTDEKSSLEGDWIDELPGMPGFRVFIKSMDCPAAIAYRAELGRQLGRKVRSRKGSVLAPELLQYIDCRTLIDVCVTNWEGLEVPVDAAGAITFDRAAIVAEKDMPFTRETLSAILLEDAPDGAIATQPAPGLRSEKIRTPDRKRARYTTRDFYSILTIAADRVAAPADEQEDAVGDAGPDTEKNSSTTGSDGSAPAEPRRRKS